MAESEAARPRIIHCAAYGNHHPGSFVPMLAAALDESQRQGWSTEVVLEAETEGARWVDELRASGALVHFAPRVKRTALGRYLRALVGRSGGKTLIHTHFTRYDLPAVMAAIGRRNVAVVWHEHTDLKRDPVVMARNVIRFSLVGRRVNLILCAAPDTARDVKRRGAPPSRVVYFHNAIDVERFPGPTAELRAAARAEFGVPKDARALLLFGWNWHRKGGDHFVSVLAALRERYPDLIGLVAIGSAETLPAARDAGVEDIVRIIPPTERIPELLMASDCMTALSRAEGGTPLSVLESLAAGTAVVASDIAGHREIGADLDGCRIVPLEPEQLEAALVETLEREPDQVERERTEARERISDEFALSAWGERLVAHYEAVLSPARPQLRLTQRSRQASRVARPRRAPRAIQLCDFRRKEGGSFIPSVISTLRAAKEAGWETGAVFIRPPEPVDWEDDIRDAGIELTFVDPGGRASLGRWLHAEVGGRGPTILHSHFTTWDVPAALTAIRDPDAVPIWHVHSTLPETPYSILRNVAKFTTLGRTTGAFLCPSQNIIEGVVGRGGPADRVLLWPSAIDLGLYPMLGEVERLEARQALGLPRDATVVLHFGWHMHLKGGDVFLRVLKELAAAGHGDIIGLERGGEEGEYMPLACELGVAERLRIIPPQPDVSRLYGAADLLLTSSRSEGMAYSVVESLASGTAVVATPIPGNTMIGRDVEALRIKGHDPASLAAGVVETLSRSDSQARGEAAQARGWISGNLSLEGNASRLLNLYEEAIAGQGLSVPFTFQA